MKNLIIAAFLLTSATAAMAIIFAIAYLEARERTKHHD
jgi:hypothetical protein